MLRAIVPLGLFANMIVMAIVGDQAMALASGFVALLILKLRRRASEDK